MARQVVEDDHVAGTQGRHQLGLDIEVEHLPIHRSVDHPRGIEAVMAQGTDERLGAPMPERRVIDQALPARGPAGGLGHVRFERCLVDEGQSFQMPGHEGLAFADPDAAKVGHVLALLLKRLQVFFLCDSPSLSSNRPTDERCTFTPCSVASSAVNSSIVRSGCAAIRCSTQPFTPVNLPRPGLPCGFGASEPVSRLSRTMSLTNLIETHSRRAASVCVLPCSTSRTARSRNSIGCGLPIPDPHICLKDMESQGKHHGNPESDHGRHALKHPHDGGATIANVDLPKGFDNDWASFMSYKDEFASENTAWDPVTPMVLDVLALQYLYGPNIVHNAGDTEFTVRRYDDYYTYWDPSGNDVVNASEALEGWNIYLPYLQISTQQSTLAGLAVPVSQDTDSFDTFAPTDLVWLMGEIENAIGSNFDDGLVGNALDNFLSSGDGDDFLRGSSGNDQLDGGAGQDTADYSGNQTSYTVQFSASGTTITDRRPSQDGTDTLVDVENLQFLDGAFDIGIRSGATGLSAEDFAAIAELYIAYFDRAPASKGLLYWGTRLDDGMTLPEIANSFFVQPETQRTYEAFLNEDGSLNNTEAFVSAVFNNVLGRDPSGPYWVNELNTNPDITPAIFILAVLNGAKAESGGAADRDYLASKTDIGVYFSAIKGLSEYDDTVSVMNIFDGSTASVNAAVSAIDQIHADALDPNNGEFLMPLVGVIDDPFAVV